MTSKLATRIFMVSPSAFVTGGCAVCGAISLLKYRDASTGMLVGGCCLGDLMRAEAMVVATFSEGLRHPTPEDLDLMP